MALEEDALARWILEAAPLDIGEMTRDWFDYWMKGEETGVQNWPAYKIFVMGENRWRGENEWPLARTEFTPFYFNSMGGAKSKNGDGTLSLEKSLEEGVDRFIYDPSNPVPTKGGSNLVGTGLLGS